MSRIVHFDLHADDLVRCKKFYTDVFGWKFEDYSDYVGKPYFGVITGDDDQPGINGGLSERESKIREIGDGFAAFICTIVVEDYDEAHEKILSAGGKVYSPKYALPGMAWQGYYLDSEGNQFGLHQPDENAQ